MNIDGDTASTSPEPPSSPRNSVEAWSQQQFTWLSNAAPMTSTQSNPTEQSQGFGQMAAWGDASVSETCMRADLFPPMQPSSSYMNPQEAIASDGRSGARCEQERILGFSNGNSTDTWSPLQSHWFNNVTPTTFNQYNPMEQPQNYGQTAAWSGDSAPPASDMTDNPFPGMELQRGHVNLQEIGPFEARDAATPPAPPQFNVDTGYPQPSTWSSDVAPPTSTQYNPMEQIQDLGQTAVWNVDSASPAPDMVNTPLPQLQPSDSHLNPQEVVPPEPTCATASAPPHSFINTGYSQHSTWPSNAATPTFTRYNPMEQIQDLEQPAAWSDDSVAVAPCVEVKLLPETQPFNGDMILLEIGPSEARRAVEVEQKGCLDPGNGKRKKRQCYDERTLLILEKHYLKTPYLDRAQKQDLNLTGLKPKQVKSWFVERRRRDVKAGVEIKNLCVDNGNSIDTWSPLQSENCIRQKWKPYNEQTTSTLEKHYLENPYPSTAEKKNLAKQTGLTSMQMRHWFDNRRRRDRAAGVEIENDKHCIKPFDERTHQILKRHYLEERFPKMARKKDLADQTGLTPQQVGTWFSNCRLRDRLTAQKKKPNGITTDAANCHIMDPTSTDDSENFDPMEQPIYVYQVSTSTTLTNGNLSPPTASLTQNPSMPMFDNPPMMAPESFQMPLQQFPTQMAMNPTFQQTAALQKPAQPQSANFYYQ